MINDITFTTFICCNEVKTEEELKKFNFLKGSLCK